MRPLRQVVPVIEVLLDLVAPDGKANDLAQCFHSFKRIVALLVEPLKGLEAVIEKRDQLNWRSCSWGRWDSLGAGFVGRAHFVHPSQAVRGVAADDEPTIQVNFQRNVEAVTGHVGVYLVACVPFPEGNAVGVGLEDLLHYLLKDEHLGLSLIFEFVVLEDVVAEEDHVDLALQDLVILRVVDILTNRADEPPASVSAVVARPSALIEQVGDESVAQGRGELDDGFSEDVRRVQKQIRAGEGISAPASCPSN